MVNQGVSCASSGVACLAPFLCPSMADDYNWDSLRTCLVWEETTVCTMYQWVAVLARRWYQDEAKYRT